MGGTQRVTDAIASRLLAVGALTLQGKSFLVGRRDLARTDTERRVLGLGSPTSWSDLQRMLQQAAEPIERRLLAAGLIMDKATIRQLRVWQTLPRLMLLPFGAIKWEIGRMRERPVGDLTALLLVTDRRDRPLRERQPADPSGEPGDRVRPRRRRTAPPSPDHRRGRPSGGTVRDRGACGVAVARLPPAPHERRRRFVRQ